MTNAHSRRKPVDANGVRLCVETFGAETDPAIVLIAGAGSSMDWWEDELCEHIARGGRFVIRYDSRDTGQSTVSAADGPPYGPPELAVDALGLLDALRISHAHVVGMSLGGRVGILLAVDHPDRVASLTLVSTSPGGGGGDLPAMSEDLAAHFAVPPANPDWSDRAAVVDYVVRDARAYAGPATTDEASLRALVETVVDRTVDIEAWLTNSLLEPGGPIRSRLGEVAAPTLVLHGTEDPLYPIAHGHALAAEIPGARLLELEGMGHEVPPRRFWDQVVEALLEHTAEAERRQPVAGA